MKTLQTRRLRVLDPPLDLKNSAISPEHRDSRINLSNRPGSKQLTVLAALARTRSFLLCKRSISESSLNSYLRVLQHCLGLYRKGGRLWKHHSQSLIRNHEYYIFSATAATCKKVIFVASPRLRYCKIRYGTTVLSGPGGGGGDAERPGSCWLLDDLHQGP